MKSFTVVLPDGNMLTQWDFEDSEVYTDSDILSDDFIDPRDED